MTKAIDMTGTVHDRLTVISRSANNAKGQACWLCSCVCGKQLVVAGVLLRIKNTTSCGCKNLDRVKTGDISRKHGRSRSSVYRIYKGMRDRCYNPNSDNYDNYGGRGIRICQRWLESFIAFLEDMGERPSPKHSVDRFPDQNGDYEPGNCRWATMKEQHCNRRDNNLITCDGVTENITEWSVRTGLSRQLILYRIRSGWPVEAALSQPSRLAVKKLGGVPC